MEGSFDTVVIGGGQAGLACGYYLRQNDKRFVILEGSHRVGESWRKRWDSLQLFTPAKFDALPGMQFPAFGLNYPTKDQVADYLELYASYFKLPVNLNSRVQKLKNDGDHYVVETDNSKYTSRNVVVTIGAFQKEYVPEFAKELDPTVKQLHSGMYRNPMQLSEGKVLVVGAGNTGAEIALELARTGHDVWLSGRDVGTLPAMKLGRILNGHPYWWVISNVMTIDTPFGRRIRDSILHHGAPLIRNNRKELKKAGVKLISRMIGVLDGQPVFQDNAQDEFGTVIWATGYRPNYTWIDLSVFDDDGLPHHDRGVALKANGLFFSGLSFQTGITSSLLGGAGKDAKYITEHLR